MKIAVVIDYKKIEKLKKEITKKEYIEKAINELAEQILRMYV